MLNIHSFLLSKERSQEKERRMATLIIMIFSYQKTLEGFKINNFILYFFKIYFFLDYINIGRVIPCLFKKKLLYILKQ